MRVSGNLELLAPARNIDIGIAAIDCGADAVYIAGPSFGARQAAGNDIAEIRQLCSHAHRFGARIFIAFNTIIFDDELARAYDMMDELQDAGADAIIIQDLALTDAARNIAVIRARKHAVPLHASTQCAIRTPEKAAFLESLGFSRLILERELSISQIKAIREAVDCELEFFVHGALCVCYSGQCYMSEHIAGRSANRGACIQACRSRYDLVDGKGRTLAADRPILSLKDLNLKDSLGALADAGITSFKIEGRLKNISYVKNIVREYSAALDELVAANPGRFARASFGKAQESFTPMPDKTFNRGYTRLFIDGTRGKWASEEAAKSMGEEIGTVTMVNRTKDEITVGPARAGISLNNGDGFSFVTRQHEVKGFRGDVCEGFTIRCKAVPDIYPGARIFRNLDAEFEKTVAKARNSRTIEAVMKIRSGNTGEGIGLYISAASEDGRLVDRFFSGTSGKATNTARMKEMLVSQLSKSAGDFNFKVSEICGDELPFLPVSAINSIRREIAEEMGKMPCVAKPLFNNTPSSILPETGEATYKDNVANGVAKKLYLALGAESIEDAFEKTHRRGAELMRTKYCVRYQMGLCPKHHDSKDAGPLFILNNRKRFTLNFDCMACEMTVSES